MRKESHEENTNLLNMQWEKDLSAKGMQWIAGVDEAGRGPLAGPVVAAAVIFPLDFNIFEVDDSKKLTAKKRDLVFDLIHTNAFSLGIGICDEKVIDEINILQATHRAMKQAIEKLSVVPDHIFVDGRFVPELGAAQTSIIGGDRKCYSIAAASVIAKVTRDRLMIEYDKTYPEYGFAQHKGYPTKKHVQAILKYGLCPIHRKSFHVKNMEKYGK